jgi:hypothetical protein
MQMAETIADCYSASRPRLIDRDEARQLARIAVFEAASDDPNVLRRRVEDALAVADRKLRRRQAIAPTVSLAVIGMEDGKPLNGIRDLRSAFSLNPRADISAGLASAIRDVCRSAAVQCGPTDPDHAKYLAGSRESRNRVADIRNRAGRLAEMRQARLAEAA